MKRRPPPASAPRSRPKGRVKSKLKGAYVPTSPVKPSERGPGGASRPRPRPVIIREVEPPKSPTGRREGQTGTSSRPRPMGDTRPAGGSGSHLPRRIDDRERGTMIAPAGHVQGPGFATGPIGNGPGMGMPDREAMHVVSLESLARAAVDASKFVQKAVFEERKHADRAIAAFLRDRRDLGPPDRLLVTQAVFALFRWKGWLDPLGLDRPEAKLLYAWILDAPYLHPVCRVWARAIGKDIGRMVSLGGAPNWTARAEGWKRTHETLSVTVDPWRLFPNWLREQLPLPPGPATPKLKYLELLNALQSRPSVWVRAQGAEPKAVWQELNGIGLRPWLHRRVAAAARLGPESNVHQIEPFQQGRLEIQDLASQAVGLACDPEPGERWWDACAGAGGKALHLSSLLKGKGLVVASDVSESKLKETVRRARRSPFRNVTTKLWDGKKVVGKPGSYDGVLVDAPCSALGTWRRNPDARWTMDKTAIDRLAETQAALLRVAAGGVKPGGTLVYSVCTLTPAETQGVLRPFLAERPEFQLDPFPHPLTLEPTDGTALVFPHEADNDAMFIARMIRTK